MWLPTKTDVIKPNDPKPAIEEIYCHYKLKYHLTMIVRHFFLNQEKAYITQSLSTNCKGKKLGI
jgi:hypothetical protein